MAEVERTSGSTWPNLYSSRATQRRALTLMWRQLLKIPKEETPQHRNAFQCSEKASCAPVCVHCLWSWQRTPLKRARFHSTCTFLSGICKQWDLPGSPPGYQVQLSQPLLTGEMLKSLHQFHDSLLNFFQYLHLCLIWAKQILNLFLAYVSITAVDHSGRHCKEETVTLHKPMQHLPAGIGCRGSSDIVKQQQFSRSTSHDSGLPLTIQLVYTVSKSILHGDRKQHNACSVNLGVSWQSWLEKKAVSQTF